MAVKIDVIKLGSFPQSVSPKNCFFMEWPELRANWITYNATIKNKTKWQQTVKWKEMNTDILLATDFAPRSQSQPSCLSVGLNSNVIDEEGNVTSNAPSNKEYLKSHLQKCIRRGYVTLALKTMAHYLELDTVGCLRRLSVIAVEDALPLDGYNILVWMMAAVSKGYLLHDEHHCWLFAYVRDLCICKYYEQIPHKQIEKSNTGWQKYIKSLSLDQLSVDMNDLIRSILLRHGFGGMRGDADMLTTVAHIWAVRARTRATFLDLLRRKNYFITPPLSGLHPNEWCLAAIDFHCYPALPARIWEKHDHLVEDDIKNAIWHCSSCITDKTNIATDLGQRQWTNDQWKTIWKEISRDVRGLAQFMIKRVHS
jgi:hypothetical protein